jgi:predicted ABC-type ATPase
VFLWLPDATAALARVAERVRLGGHDVPATVVRRRYKAGLKNFFRLYQPLATTWQVLDNSRRRRPTRVAAGRGRGEMTVADALTWNKVLESVRNA